MGRFAFVAVLFVMASSCLALAIAGRSWGWGIGGLAFLCVGIYALGQFNAERVDGPEVASNRFIGYAFLFLLAGFALIFLFFER